MWIFSFVKVYSSLRIICTALTFFLHAFLFYRFHIYTRQRVLSMDNDILRWRSISFFFSGSADQKSSSENGSSHGFLFASGGSGGHLCRLLRFHDFPRRIASPLSLLLIFFFEPVQNKKRVYKIDCVLNYVKYHFASLVFRAFFFGGLPAR